MIVETYHRKKVQIVCKDYNQSSEGEVILRWIFSLKFNGFFPKKFVMKIFHQSNGVDFNNKITSLKIYFFFLFIIRHFRWKAHFYWITTWTLDHCTKC